MSSMIPQPPSSISLGGGPGAGPGGPGGPPSGPGGGNGSPGDRLSAALTKLGDDATAALTLAQEPADKAAISTVANAIHKLLAQHQADMDGVMGGGPGAKVMRRNAPPAAA